MTDLRTRLPRFTLPVALFLLVNLAFLTVFGDRDGYEGDDMNSVVPMAHLAAAKQGLLLIYRYAWQPLAYEVGALVWRLFGTPTAVFVSAGVTGAVALAILLLATLKEAEGRLWIALVALLAVPELWYTALYYNSTVIGFPLEALAILLLAHDSCRRSAAIAGIAMGLAILMRMDFVLVCPLLAVLAWWRTRDLLRPGVLAGAVVAVLAAGFLLGWLQPAEIARIQHASAAEIAARAHQPGWDWHLKLGVFTILLSPIGWLLLAIGVPAALLATWRARGAAALLWPVAALPALYPLLSLTSPKYAVPLLGLAPLIFVHAQDAAGRLFRYATPAIAVLLTVPIFVSISLYGYAPFVEPALLATRPVGTHDGARAYGGYLWQMIATDGPAAITDEQRRGWAIADAFLAEQDMRVVGDEDFFRKGGIAWRNAQLALEKRGVHGELVAPHQLLFRAGGHSLLLSRDPVAAPSLDLRDAADPIAGG
jgi:hypothetical protein